jgi:hypothetical protein
MYFLFLNFSSSKLLKVCKLLVFDGYDDIISNVCIANFELFFTVCIGFEWLFFCSVGLIILGCRICSEELLMEDEER